MTVVGPLGHKTVHYFSVFPGYGDWSPYTGNFLPEEYGLPLSHLPTSDGGATARFLSIDQYDCPGGTCPADPKRQSYVRYELDADVSCGVNGGNFGPDCLNSNKRVAAERTLFRDDPNSSCSGYPGATCNTATVDYSSFDGLGHYRTSITGGAFDAGNQRTTTTDYNPGSGTYPGSFVPWPTSSPWVINTYDYQQVTENSVTATTEYCFDPSTGYLNRKRTLASGTNENGNDLIVTFAADLAGNTTSEQYFGGDIQSVPTGPLCSVVLPPYKYRIDHTYQNGARNTSRYYKQDGSPASFYVLDQDIDGNTGLVIRSRDSAGISTDFTYDGMNRVTGVKPQTSFDGGAWFQNVYTNASPSNPAKVNLYAFANGSNTNPLAQEEYTFDALGRLSKQRHLLPDGTWGKRVTTYDGMGRKTSVSEVESDATQDTDLNKTLFQYDAFGRRTCASPPDSTTGTPCVDGNHDVLLTHTGTRQVARQSSIATGPGVESLVITSIETYDRQGRLWRVAEPSKTDGSNATTTYGYDVGNRLASVTMSDGSNTQSRTLSYDNRGFLQYETLPETGPSGNGTITYSNYDARGHVGRKQEGFTGASYLNDLTFAYDWAERLTDVYQAGLSTALEHFDFAIANGSNDWANGKLRSSTMTDPSSNETATVSQTFTYGGVGGAVSQKTTQIGLTGSTTGNLDPPVLFTQSYTWTDLGQLDRQSYPSLPGVAPDRTVYDAYANGYLTAVLPEYANAITYHPNGMMASVAHANGMKDTQSIADGQAGRPSDWMARPISVDAANGGPSLWATGTYAYDGAGNIKTMGSDIFTYDGVSRLASATLHPAGASHSQSYGHDAFGNLRSVTTDNSPQALDTLGTTNRLGASSYDAAGNMTGWSAGAHSFAATYNHLNMAASTSESDGANTLTRLYAYDADGERTLIRDRSVTPIVYTVSLRDLAGKVIRELAYTPSSQSWAWKKDTIYRGGALLASVGAGEGIRHYHLDHLGTPRLVTDRCGQQVAQPNYYPFGQEILATSTQDGTERMRFTGHQRDLGLLDGADATKDDLDYMHARFGSPFFGRFLSVDPAGGNAHAPQSWNLFAYVRNNPLNLADPTGTSIDVAGCRNSLNGCAPMKVVEEAFGEQAWKYTEVNGGSVTLKKGVYWKFLAAKFGPAIGALGFMAGSAHTFTIFTDPGIVRAALARQPVRTRGGTTEKAEGGGANIYLDLNALPMLMGGVMVSPEEALVHESGHAIAPYFPISIAAINASHMGNPFTAQEGFSVLLENSWRRMTLGLRDIRTSYSDASGELQDIRNVGDKLEFMWPTEEDQ